MQQTNTPRPPSRLWAFLAAPLVAVSIPVDGNLGIALALAGVACSVTYLVRRVRYDRRTGAHT